MAAKLEGLKELDAQLQQLIKSVEPDKVEPIRQQAGQMIVDAGKPVTPYDPGREKGKHLRDAWVTKLMPRRRDKNPAPAIAAIDAKIAPHAHLVEKGHGGPHPAPPHPFFRPTWDKMKRPVKNHIIDKLRDNINQAVK
jgi:HK97 gp10 family phage protein